MIETGVIKLWVLLVEEAYRDPAVGPGYLESELQWWCAENGCTLLTMGDVRETTAPPGQFVVRVRLTVEPWPDGIFASRYAPTHDADGVATYHQRRPAIDRH